jgi:hypothetical protein
MKDGGINPIKIHMVTLGDTNYAVSFGRLMPGDRIDFVAESGEHLLTVAHSELVKLAGQKKEGE